MKCSNCGCELTNDMFISNLCFNCGHSVSESKQTFEEEQKKINAQKLYELQQQKELLSRLEAERFKNHMLTTGYSYEGYTIVKYLGLVSGDTVIGTGYLSSLDASLSDLFGVEAIEYSKKIKLAKQKVLSDMIQESFNKGGNAIIGVSFEVVSFSRDLIGVSVNGTSIIVKEDNIF